MASKLLMDLGPGETLTLTGPGGVHVSAAKTVTVVKASALGCGGFFGKATAKFAVPAISSHFPAMAVAPVFGVGLLVLGAMWLVKSWTVEDRQYTQGREHVE
ncbi:MAG TPA: hypothetical protein HPQ00_06595 [Magnetococcales bacterium]|nr:hypothetical protein [Magnetococcales bacterium]